MRNPSFNSFFLPVFGALVLFLTCAPSKASARSCVPREVTVLNYYGYMGKDPHGGKLYGVKVKFGSDYYYAELSAAMPCLLLRINQKVDIVMGREGRHWQTVTYGSQTANIHHITKLPNRDWKPKQDFFLSPKPQSPFYYD